MCKYHSIVAQKKCVTYARALPLFLIIGVIFNVFLKYFKAILFADFRVNDPPTNFIVSDHMDGRISHWGKSER